jgi:hypothetical protein
MISIVVPILAGAVSRPEPVSFMAMLASGIAVERFLVDKERWRIARQVARSRVQRTYGGHAARYP